MASLRIDTFQCQQCKARLSISASSQDASASGGALPSHLEESFLVLDEAFRAAQAGQEPSLVGPSGRRLEESFVVLPAGARPGGASASAAAPADSASAVDPLAPQRVPFDAHLRALARVFEAATDETAVEHPICTDCAAEVQHELEQRLGELQADAAAYEAAIARLAAQAADAAAPSEEEQERRHAAELAEARREVAREQAELAAAEAELAAARAQLATAESAAVQLDEQEDQYWQAANAFSLQLQDHMDERDAVRDGIERKSAALARLAHTNVYNDVFRIWFDGPFGTISGLRLGRTPGVAVDWDEINAAWGQAVLLLSSLAKACGVTFKQYRLHPAGSYPRVADARGGGANNLHGPVSKLMAGGYDRAQVGFLACLKEFAEWLQHRAASDPHARGFQLPWPVDGDKVGGLSIRYLLSKDKTWTKALKYMLVDLKFCLKEVVSLQDRGALRAPGGGSGAGRGAGGGAPVTVLQREGHLQPPG